MLKTALRGLAIAVVCIGLVIGASAIILHGHSGNQEGAARTAWLQLRSAHQKLAAAQGEYGHRNCGKASQPLECDLQDDQVLRGQLSYYAATVSHISLPGATAQEIAVRIEKSASEVEQLMAQLDAAASITAYRSLTDALGPSLQGNNYELEDSTTYLAFLLFNLSKGRTMG